MCAVPTGGSSGRRCAQLGAGADINGDGAQQRVSEGRGRSCCLRSAWGLQQGSACEASV
jgi:hypothetical protein